MSIKPFFLCIVYAVAFALISNNYAHAQESTETTQRRFSPEIGALLEVSPFHASAEITANIKNRNNDVLGVNIGLFDFFMDNEGDTKGESTIKYSLHYRHYFPFGKRNRLAFYPDVTFGELCHRETSCLYDYDENGEMINYSEKRETYYEVISTIRLGLSIRMLRESRFSFGVSIMPTYPFDAEDSLFGMYIEFTI